MEILCNCTCGINWNYYCLLYHRNSHTWQTAQHSCHTSFDRSIACYYCCTAVSYTHLSGRICGLIEFTRPIQSLAAQVTESNSSISFWNLLTYSIVISLLFVIAFSSFMVYTFSCFYCLNNCKV